MKESPATIASLGEPAARIAPPGWMIAPGAVRVLAALAPEKALFVGGCVRDALLGLVPADIDIATQLLPDAVTARLKKAGIKAIPTGIEHGTVTALVVEAGTAPEQLEITTLRRDVATDGRHAEVSFGTDWRVDAERRDFTINALYADASGAVFDPVGGLADLQARRVRFIGDPAARVAEDYLRVLRFFRFHARFGGAEPDAAALAACAAAAGKLDRLSGERVRDELLKILALPRAAEALELMRASGVLEALLPGTPFKAAVFRLLMTVTDDVWLRLRAILPSDAAIARLKLSRAQQHRLETLCAPPPVDWPALAAADAARLDALFYDHGHEALRDHAILLSLEDALARRPVLDRVLDAAAHYRRPVFPLRGSDLLKHGLKPGPNISLILKELEAWWRDGGFSASREACLNEMRLRVRLDDAPPPEEEKKPEEKGTEEKKAE